MKLSKEVQIRLLVLMLILTSIILYVVLSEKQATQKWIDQIFIDTVSDSMSGLNKDYSQLDDNEKVNYYHQVISNLQDAQDIFHITSYKENDNYFKILNRLYLYLINNKNDNYQIDDSGYIFGLLAKLLVYPDDAQLISDFNAFLDKKL